MTFERIMGLEVIDDIQYDNYRKEMEPLLNSFKGAFGYVFVIEKVLRSKNNNPINRVFTIEFPSEKVMNDFFSSSEYLKIKDTYFDKSVKSKTVISMHEKNHDS